MNRNSRQQQADIRLLELQQSETQNLLKTQVIINQAPAPAPTPTVNPQAANQLRNGDLSHSERTWFQTSALEDDQNKECAHWFSHDAPSASQQLHANTSRTGGSPNQALKFNTHSVYDDTFCDWERPRGIGRLNSVKSLDAPLPQNLAGASRTEHVVMIAARRNQYIIIPSNCRIYAGIWDNTSGQRDWLKASAAFTLSGSVTRTPLSTIERRYKVYARTDRGYSFLSTELTVANAPDDNSFIPNDVYVALSWSEIPNTLAYYVYRYTPSTGVYELLKEITSGATTYNDQNSIARTATAYPTATNDRDFAYFATRANEISSLAIDGVSARWDTLSLPVRVPPQYNQTNTTDKQWIRIGLTVAPDLQVTDAVTNGTSTVTSVVAQFNADHVGMSVIITDGGANSLTTTIASYVDTDEITLTAAPSWSGSNNTLTITGGGLFGVLVDLIHSSFAAGATYAPNAEDLTRTLQPVATPNGSTQGGTGTGGNPSGGVACVWDKEKVTVWRGNEKVQINADEVKINDALISGNLKPNYVIDIRKGAGEIVELRTSNKVRKFCTPSHRLITSVHDERGTSVSTLKVGDTILTEINDVQEWSQISLIRYTGKRESVRTFSLSEGHLYLAGTYYPNLIKRLINLCFRRKVTAGIFAHNAKPLEIFN